jgi:uncharacterized surface protein with fasciclin (FAS1) repeats
VISERYEHDSGSLYVIDGVLLPPQNFSSTAVDANLTSFAPEYENAGILSHLGDDGGTIFAPNNEALSAIRGVITNMTANDIQRLFSYHTVDSMIVYSDELQRRDTLPALATTDGVGADIKITTIGSHIYIDAAMIIEADIPFSNGVLHIIDNVLNPDNQTAVPLDGGSQIAFAIAQDTEQVATPSSTSSSENFDPKPSNGPSTAVLAGGIVGALLGAFLVSAIAFFVWRRGRHYPQTGIPQQETSSINGGSSIDSSPAPSSGETTVTNSHPSDSGWSKAELSGEDIERQVVLPKHELWTSANVHEADTLGIGRGLVELSGDSAVSPRDSQASSTEAVFHPMSPMSPLSDNNVLSPLSPMHAKDFMSSLEPRSGFRWR